MIIHNGNWKFNPFVWYCWKVTYLGLVEETEATQSCIRLMIVNWWDMGSETRKLNKRRPMRGLFDTTSREAYKDDDAHQKIPWKYNARKINVNNNYSPSEKINKSTGLTYYFINAIAIISIFSFPEYNKK